MGKFEGIVKLAIFGAIVGAIIAAGICLFDTTSIGQDIYGEPIFGSTYPSLTKKFYAWVNILPEWMLIGAIAVTLTAFMSGGER